MVNYIDDVVESENQILARKLYNSYFNDNIIEISNLDSTPLRYTLLGMEHIKLEDSTYNSLDSYPYAEKIANALNRLPADYVKNNFGEEYFLWSRVKSLDDDFSLVGELTQAQEDLKSDFDLRKLRKSQRVLTEHYMDDNSVEKILGMYNFLDNLQSLDISSINLNEILKDCDVDIPKRSRSKSKFSIEVLNTRAEYDATGQADKYNDFFENGEGYNVILDGPIGIALSYKEKPIGVLSYIVKDDSLSLIQIQGINKKKFKSNGLVVENEKNSTWSSMNSSKFAIELSEIIAKKLGYSRTSVQGGLTNPWIKKVYADGTFPFPLEKALEVYDIPAKKLGYHRESDDNWYKTLK